MHRRSGDRIAGGAVGGILPGSSSRASISIDQGAEGTVVAGAGAPSGRCGGGPGGEGADYQPSASHGVPCQTDYRTGVRACFGGLAQGRGGLRHRFRGEGGRRGRISISLPHASVVLCRRSRGRTRHRHGSYTHSLRSWRLHPPSSTHPHAHPFGPRQCKVRRDCHPCQIRTGATRCHAQGVRTGRAEGDACRGRTHRGGLGVRAA
mmetsp:Transcript_24535/g.52032  ORF Transcript_24535/g.52032 Transcript_24535/m.52032 type:complete len:206 (+) Transcript_24535:850-1467(+)